MKRMRKASESELEAEITTATFKLPRGLLAEFRRVAKSHERTFSQELRQIMAEHIARERLAA